MGSLLAAISVNSALIEFYWGLGRDISEKYPGKKRGIDFFGVLSHDLRNEISDEGSFSVRNLKYVLNFYKLYAYRQQVVADKPCKGGKSQRVANGKKNSGLCPSVSTRGNEQCLVVELVQVPWGHHIQIISKCKGDREKLGLPLGITDYELKRILPTQAQLAKCYADAEKQLRTSEKK